MTKFNKVFYRKMLADSFDCFSKGRRKELMQIINEKDLKIDITDGTKGIRVSNNVISVSENFLMRVHALSFAHYSIWLKIKDKGISGVTVDPCKDIEIQRYMKIILWARALYENDRCSPYTENNFNEAFVNKEDDRLADTLFLVVFACLVYHEIGHVILKHKRYTEDKDKNHKMEYDADKWMYDWVMNNVNRYNDVDEFIHRSMGIALTLGILSMETYPKKEGSKTHPNVASRMLKFFDNYITEDDPNNAHPTELAIAFAMSVLQIHLSFFLSEYEKILSKTYDSFRDHIIEVSRILDS